MKKNVLILFLYILSPTAAAGSQSDNPFLDMMRSMLDMFEMMQLYQEFSSRTGNPPAIPPSTWPAPPPSNPTLPPFSPQSTRDLEGAWASDNNILLAIKDHLGRIYWTRDNYRDFQIEVLPPRLRFTDQNTGQSQEFDVSLRGDSLVLRDNRGRLALFRRIRGTQPAQPAQPTFK